MRHIIILSLFLWVTGCSLFSPVKSKIEHTYTLDRTTPVVQRKPQPITILVLKPEAYPLYDTVEIAYKKEPHQISYFAKNQWAATPAQMLQGVIVQSLQNSHHFRAVVTPPFSGSYDYILATEIQQLLFDFSEYPNLVRFKLQAQLIQVSNNQLLGAKQFKQTAIISGPCANAGVFAANRALAELLVELTRFTVRST